PHRSPGRRRQRLDLLRSGCGDRRARRGALRRARAARRAPRLRADAVPADAPAREALLSRRAPHRRGGLRSRRRARHRVDARRAARRRRDRVPGTLLMSWPLMRDNIAREDLDAVIRFLSGDEPVLTQSKQVELFEQEWSSWLGVRHSVFVNSGSSANLITLAALRQRAGVGEVIVPTLTWSSDVAAVLHCGMTPVFVDIDPRTLGMDDEQVIERLGPPTRAVFLTHVLGYNALSQRLPDPLRQRAIPLLEDVCESHGATFQGRKLGSFGLASNFSFYYAHHMSTIEGGMVCTDDSELWSLLRMLRSHGLVRESGSEAVKRRYVEQHPDLTPDFIFALPGFN